MNGSHGVNISKYSQCFVVWSAFLLLASLLAINEVESLGLLRQRINEVQASWVCEQIESCQVVVCVHGSMEWSRLTCVHVIIQTGNHSLSARHGSLIWLMH